MELTNRLNLPAAIVRAVANDSYNPGDGDFTATGLLKPASQARLQKKHSSELVEDAADRLWSLIGQLGHLLLERAGGNEIKEERYYAQFGEYRISAQIDNLCLEHNRLSDYKVTTGWSFKNNQPPKPEFVQQMNIQAEILRRNGYAIDSIQIVAILRDWSKMEAMRNAEYPQAQVIVQPIPIWTSEQATAFINLRVAAHVNASEASECSDSEMWARDGVWAITKKGQKKATKLHYSAQAANSHLEDLGTDYVVAYRPGARTRCEYYCNVNKFCEQYQTYKQGVE